MKPKIYLDYAASTPVAPEVLKAMAPYWNKEFGNPGSLHSFGQAAMSAVDKAREAIAKAIGADFREVIFTGSATESNNIAFRGITRKFTRNYAETFRDSQRGVRAGLRPKLIISAVEHESILDTARDLESEGVEVIYVPVDEKGVVDLKKIEEALDERTILVSVMYVNNEVGSIQPIAKISEIIGNFRRESGIRTKESRNPEFMIHNSLFPLLHTDAAQALAYLDCNVGKLGVDLLTLSGQKIYGPKGAGALYIRNPKSQIPNPKQIRNLKDRNSKRDEVWNLELGAWNFPLVAPMVTGGGQEFGLRSGTENVPAIVGFGKAAELAVKGRKADSKKVSALKERFWRGLKKFYPAVEMNPPHKFMRGMNGASNVPHILNVYFPTAYAGDLLVKLDIAGIAASSGSACSARSFSPSRVLQVLGLPQERIRGSLRFSFGRTTTREEIDEALKRMRVILK